MYYPSVFRRVYTSENWSDESIYTCVYDYSADGKRRNSIFYEDELDLIKNRYPNAVFIVEALFTIDDNDAKRAQSSDLSVQDKDSLKIYLNLIVNQKVRSKFEQSRYYMNLLNKYVNEEANLDEVLKELEKRQTWYMKFWITAVYREEIQFSKGQVLNLVTYILTHRKEYAYNTVPNKLSFIGGRAELVSFIPKLFAKQKSEDMGMGDDYKEIGNYFFNEMNMLEKIADGGILEIYDLMFTRLECCAERMSSVVMKKPFYSVVNIIGKFENETFHFGGNLRECTINEMRVFSQRCFDIFKKRYIDSRKNFWKDIDAVTVNDIRGNLEEKNYSAETLKNELVSFKRSAKVFLCYQFGANNPDSMGVPCGYYDQTGNKDQGKIRKEFSQYMMSTVFTDKGAFIEFVQLSTNTQWNGQWTSKFERLFEFIDEDCLLDWWQTHSEVIKKRIYRTMM